MFYSERSLMHSLLTKNQGKKGVKCNKVYHATFQNKLYTGLFYLANLYAATKLDERVPQM